MTHTPDTVEYCAPPDEQQISWVIIFSDPDVNTMYFCGAGAEEGARRAWREYSSSWSCTLMHTAKNKPNTTANDH